MAAMTVTTAVKGQKIDVSYDFGDDLKSATALMTDKVVFAQYRKGARLSLQAFVRGMVTAEKSMAEITEALKTWKPGTSERTSDPLASIKRKLGNMTDEQRAAAKEALRKELGL